MKKYKILIYKSIGNVSKLERIKKQAGNDPDLSEEEIDEVDRLIEQAIDRVIDNYFNEL